MANYKVLTGLEYLGKRVEAGAVVSDLPPKSIKWLRESGLIEPADATVVVEPEDEPVATDDVEAE